jgi:molybdopterin-guanine dinucleotide biosynthesis protein B
MTHDRPPVLSLLGPSGSGKTTLAAALVARWTRAGRRVGYVKHASHGFDVDRPGKDSARVTEAGAAGVALTGPGGFAYLERGEPLDPRAIVASHFADRDVVVLEGFRGAGFPAVVLPGGQPAERALAEATGPLLALAGEGEDVAAAAAARGVPRFDRDAVDALAAHLERALGLGPGRARRGEHGGP